ncbi:sensor histidine kinase [Rhodococcus sp. AG1013]|uniref:sensor histidine kinase n=1 Tax=unclassified Rhodococcus (in: high G+C Gram-positive bacteria) TaxID=192944 RepID=UPI000E0A28A8|nr:HAMP domain-containing sensor histidine kinase [Rhodococcus sp. AG1013]RDI30250.1 two-component system OmpR family sensor kinase [Rhodococcus sp. AG1013]
MRRLRALPLRITLVAALLLLAAAGLLASGVAVTSAMESSLIARTDRQLFDAAHGWAKPRDSRPGPPVAEPGPNRPPSPFYVRVTAPDGTVHLEVNDESTNATPQLVADPGPVTVGSAGGGDIRWREMTVTTPSGTTTVAIKLTDIDETVDRLVVLQLGIGIVVLAVLGFAGYFVVRRSLRPLQEVEETAADIAAGDLHRRVPERDQSTEVGRLSSALNGMLAQIQSAFAATEASEESARRSEERMRRFVADASHELRTPLATIRGFAELYRQGASTDAEMVLSRIESQATRMGLLVEDLLMLARMDAQRPFERHPVDLLTVAADAVHDARALAPGRRITLEVLPGSEPAQVMGDDARLRQVLGNLMGNALEHTPGAASVTVRVGTDGTDAVLEVSDTGPGLGDEDAARVFERFYRADESRTRASGGSGLGLSIVAAIVAAHDGTVTVDSAPGKGATFRVRLPRG